MSTLPQPIHFPPTDKQTRRFWNYVDKSGDCWIWRGTVTSAGYGVFNVRPYNYRAHRLSWYMAHGQIPDGMLICHTCDNRLCVNPDHLFLGTPLDNHNDMKQKGRAPTGEKHGRRTRPDRSARGERQGSAKLTVDQVIEIRRRYYWHGHYDSNAVALAQEFGVSRATVLAVVTRYSWRHILPEERIV